MRTLFLSLGAASLALAPVSASAGTRANDVVPAAAQVSHSVQGVQKTESLAGSGGLIAVLAFWVAIIVVIVATDDDEDSPG